MATVADLIRRSLLLIGQVAESETPTAAQLADGFVALNEMLDEWSADGFDVSTFTATTDEVDLAPGYAKAIRYGLAVDLADEYGVAVPGAVASGAEKGKTLIKRNEFEPTYLECDAAVLRPTSGTDTTTLE